MDIISETAGSDATKIDALFTAERSVTVSVWKIVLKADRNVYVPQLF